MGVLARKNGTTGVTDSSENHIQIINFPGKIEYSKEMFPPSPLSVELLKQSLIDRGEWKTNIQ